MLESIKVSNRYSKQNIQLEAKQKNIGVKDFINLPNKSNLTNRKLLAHKIHAALALKDNKNSRKPYVQNVGQKIKAN